MIHAMMWYMGSDVLTAFCRSIACARNGIQHGNGIRWQRGELLNSRKNCSHLIKLSKQMKYIISVWISDSYLWLHGVFVYVFVNAEQIFIWNHIARSCQLRTAFSFFSSSNWNENIYLFYRFFRSNYSLLFIAQIHFNRSYFHQPLLHTLNETKQKQRKLEHAADIVVTLPNNWTNLSAFVSIHFLPNIFQ